MVVLECTKGDRTTILTQGEVPPETLGRLLKLANLKTGYDFQAGDFSEDVTEPGLFIIHFFRVKPFFYVDDLKKLLEQRDLRLGKLEHLLLMPQDSPLLDWRYPMTAFGSGVVTRPGGDWLSVVYPALKGQGYLGTVEVDGKEYNQNNVKWIKEEVAGLAIRMVT